ncbi:hypothetical protein F0562_014971 [Nyssa sinensis]|uniref:cyclic pyranopterin monophosphate synthase n=1 Tax=Nyssa sinensis TaxID=561372 RepID=A0A5J4ZUG0_9ASTE|nr:hypothetical protein F0562_014971 [Nyssa sinensis]
MEHLLTTKWLESFAKQRADEVQHLVGDVWARDQGGEAVNLREVLGAFSMNNVTRMLLGKQYFGAESAGPQEAMEFMHITHELFWLLGLIYLGDYLPFWRWVDPYGCEKKMREVEKRVEDFHMKILEEQRKRKESGGEVDDGEMDFVDVLLSLPCEDGKEHLDDVEIKALIQVIFFPFPFFSFSPYQLTWPNKFIGSFLSPFLSYPNRCRRPILFTSRPNPLPSQLHTRSHCCRRPSLHSLSRPNKWPKVFIEIIQPLLVMFLRRVAVRLPLSRKLFSSKCSDDFASAIAELNKEMECVFGEPPPTSNASSINNQIMTQDSQFVSPEIAENEFSLSHIGSRGEAQMVDVSPKVISKRVAVASCKVNLGKKVFDLVSANQMSKGDVLSVAKIAGISGAKQTSNLIPLCHNISLTHVSVDLTLNPNDFSVEIEGEAASTGKTGVEMEAMTAVTVAGLTVYDMCKAGSKDIQITDVRLERKTGGKSGEWSRDE